MLLVKLICKERNKFSIGKDYTNQICKIVHSDTIFSAISNNMRIIYGKNTVETFLEHLVQDASLKISSCFHFIDVYKDDKYAKSLYFIPKPLIRFPFDATSQQFFEENPKIFKKIKFISLSIIKGLQEGKKLSLTKYHILSDDYLLDTEDLTILGLDKFLEEKEQNIDEYQTIKHIISLYNITEEQKVSIKRATMDSIPYTTPIFRFNTSKYFIWKNNIKINYTLEPGYYFLMDYNGLNEETLLQLKTSINFIMDQGLGGDRSIGCGLVDEVQFLDEKQFPYISLFNQKEEGSFTNLSFVYPNLEDMESIKYFHLYDRTGFIYSIDSKTERFNDIKFIEEGSIFTKKIIGKLIQVATPKFISTNHKVYKNGIGFYLNIGKIEGYERL